MSSELTQPIIYTSEMITDEFLKTRPLSPSSLKAFRKSPRHYLMYLNKTFVQSDAMKLGSLIDCLALEPESFKKRYLVINSKPNMRSNAGKEEWEMFASEAMLNKQSIITQEDLDTAQRSVESLYSYKVSRELLEAKKNVQGEIRWTDKKTGLPILGRIDFESEAWGNKFIVDLKSARDADPDVFNRQAYDFDYHFQAGGYLEGYHKKRFQFPSFIFLAVETSEPFNVSVNFCEQKYTEQGKVEFRGTLMAFRYCMDHNLFDSGYEFRLMGLGEYFPMRLPSYYKPKYQGYEV